jgi:hypothetical protein
MNIEYLLLKKKSDILNRWFNLILEGYPPAGSSFFKAEANRFRNPVSYQLTQGIEGIYNALAEGKDPEEIRSFLEEIIRIRAVQEMPPSEAVSFFAILKKIVREELNGETVDGLSRFDSKLDKLTFMSFDVYMNYREKLFKLKVNDVKNRVSGLLRMSGLATELDERLLKSSEGKIDKARGTKR